MIDMNCSFCKNYSRLRRENPSTERTISEVKAMLYVQIRDTTYRKHVYSEEADGWLYRIKYCPVCGIQLSHA